MSDLVTVFNHTFQSSAVATGAGTAMNVGGLPAVGVQVEGITNATVTFQTTQDGATWHSAQAFNIAAASMNTTTIEDGVFIVSVAGMDQLRCNITAWVAGTITVTGKGLVGGVAFGSKVQPFAAIQEGGLTELVGINEEVSTDDYSASVGVALGGTYSGEILSFTFYATEDGTGAIQDSAGILYIFDADPTISSGDTSMTAAERVTVIGQVDVEAGDWVTDANGGSASIKDQPVPFHALATLYFAWFHTDAQDLNDVAGDDEQLEMNFHFRRDS